MTITKVFLGMNLSNKSYENISSELITPLNVYQLFYVFEIGAVSTSKRLLFATNPSEPIRTTNANEPSSAILRASLDTWMIILISAISKHKFHNQKPGFLCHDKLEYGENPHELRETYQITFANHANLTNWAVTVSEIVCPSLATLSATSQAGPGPHGFRDSRDR